MTTLREALNKPGCERIKDYYSVGPIQKAAVEQFLDEYMALAIKETVNKFLGWKLPLDFYPDNGISFDKKYVEKWGMPTGTNLLTADQATEMFKHCLSVTTQPETQNELLKENTRLKELLGQSLGSLKFAKSVIGHPDDEGMAVISVSIDNIEKEGIK